MGPDTAAILSSGEDRGRSVPVEHTAFSCRQEPKLIPCEGRWSYIWARGHHSSETLQEHDQSPASSTLPTPFVTRPRSQLLPQTEPAVVCGTNSTSITDLSRHAPSSLLAAPRGLSSPPTTLSAFPTAPPTRSARSTAMPPPATVTSAGLHPGERPWPMQPLGPNFSTSELTPSVKNPGSGQLSVRLGLSRKEGLSSEHFDAWSPGTAISRPSHAASQPSNFPTTDHFTSTRGNPRRITSWLNNVHTQGQYQRGVPVSDEAKASMSAFFI